MTEPTAHPDLAAVLSEVLAGHRMVARLGYMDTQADCTACDWQGDDDDPDAIGWDAHLAAALVSAVGPLLEQARAEALREAAEAATQFRVMVQRPGFGPDRPAVFRNPVAVWLRVRADSLASGNSQP